MHLAAANLIPDTRLLRIRGLVQGVGFRYSLSAEAQALGLGGWVRNRHDGSVEALVQGPPAAIDALVAWAQHGPPAARVDTVDITPVTEAPCFADFAQRASA